MFLSLNLCMKAATFPHFSGGTGLGVDGWWRGTGLSLLCPSPTLPTAAASNIRCSSQTWGSIAIPHVLRPNCTENTRAPLLSALQNLSSISSASLSLPAPAQGQPKYSEFCLFYCKTCYLTSFLDFIKNLSLGAFLLQSTHIFLTSSLRKITIRHDFHSVLPISLLSFHPMPRDVAFTLNTRCPWKCQLTTA